MHTNIHRHTRGLSEPRPLCRVVGSLQIRFWTVLLPPPPHPDRFSVLSYLLIGYSLLPNMQPGEHLGLEFDDPGASSITLDPIPVATLDGSADEVQWRASGFSEQILPKTIETRSAGGLGLLKQQLQCRGRRPPHLHYQVVLLSTVWNSVKCLRPVI